MPKSEPIRPGKGLKTAMINLWEYYFRASLSKYDDPRKYTSLNALLELIFVWVRDRSCQGKENLETKSEQSYWPRSLAISVNPPGRLGLSRGDYLCCFNS